jgi:hypothetical protein
MMQIRNTTDTNAKVNPLERLHHLFDIFLPMESLYSTARAVAMFVLVVGTVVGGGVASAGFYSDALPGDRLYTLKTAVERIELALAPNDDYRTRLHAEFADHRMDEAASLAEGAAARQAHLPDVLARFSQEVGALSSGLGSLSGADLDLAKSLERRMGEYQVTLRRAAAVLPSRYRPAIDEARDLVGDVSIRAMAVIVENHRRGSDQASGLVVATKLGDHLREVEEKIVTVEQDEQDVVPQTEKARAAIAEAKELVTEGKYEAALSKIVEVAELTKDVKGIDELLPATVEGSETEPEVRLDLESQTPAGQKTDPKAETEAETEINHQPTTADQQ